MGLDLGLLLGLGLGLMREGFVHCWGWSWG